MISYLHTIKDELVELTKYLYENPEESFQEHKAYSYIIDMLKKHDFKVTEHYLDINTSFYAEYGSGHPKICYLCEYDAHGKDGHTTGHNLISTMSLGAAFALSKVIKKLGSGTVIILGCPGEFKSGAKITMSKQGTFNDIDVCLMAHPDIETALSGTSRAIEPIKITYNVIQNSIPKVGNYSAQEASLFTFNALNFLIEGFPKDCAIDGIFVQSSTSPYTAPVHSQSSFYIRAPKMEIACEIEKKIRELVRTVSNIMEVQGEVCMHELPYDELVTNNSLSRLFSHNLKECGIIDINDSKDTPAGLSLGTVSRVVPCIHPFISIVKDNNVPYFSPEFAEATISEYAINNCLIAAEALAITGLDLVENENLLSEVKTEFYESFKLPILCDQD
jgi:metal-dependent amidase/aminoacylase/carboxypeptidase family protein